MTAIKKHLLLLCLGLLFSVCPMPAAVAEQVSVISASDLESIIESHKGRPLLLVYWASWCMPCRLYKEKLVDLLAAWPESDLEILWVSLDTDHKMLENYLEKNSLPFKTFKASDSFIEALAGTPVPTTILYSRDGLEARRLTGNVDERRLQHYVKKLFLPAPE